MDSSRVASEPSGLEGGTESTSYYAVRLACPESVLENQDCANLVCRVEGYGDVSGCSYQDGFVTALIEKVRVVACALVWPGRRRMSMAWTLYLYAS